MNEINWLIVIPGWLGMFAVVISQIAYMNRWIGRSETKTEEARKRADDAHTRLDELEKRESTLGEDIAAIKTDVCWIKNKLTELGEK